MKKAIQDCELVTIMQQAVFMVLHALKLGPIYRRLLTCDHVLMNKLDELSDCIGVHTAIPICCVRQKIPDIRYAYLFLLLPLMKRQYTSFLGRRSLVAKHRQMRMLMGAGWI